MIFYHDWLLFDQSKVPNPVCNFTTELLSVLKIMHAGDREPRLHVTLKPLFKNGKPGREFTVPLSDIEKIKWADKDLRCRIHPEMNPGKAQRYIANEIRSALPTAPVVRQFIINRLGLHMIEGVPYFCTGGGLITPPTNHNTCGIEIRLGPIPQKMDIDPDLSEEEAVAGMMELISLSPNPGRIILAQVLLYLMYDVYKTAWKPPCCCVFLYGTTGTKKTTLSAFLTQIYDRAKGILSPLRLNSSVPSAIEVLYESHGCVFVLDDFFRHKSPKIRSQQIETFFEITRVVADGVKPGRMRGKRVTKEPPTCGVLFTGEFLVGEGSDAARLLPVEMTEPDGKKLKYFQDNPLLISTFYHFFITWVIENFHDICDLLQEWLQNYRQINGDIHPRLQETHFFFNTAYAVLQQYLYARGFVSQEDAEKLHRSFRQRLTSLILSQNERVKQGHPHEPRAVADAFLAHIRSMYKSGQVLLADSAKQFNEDSHDGLVHEGCLCLHGKRFRAMIKNFGSTASTDEVVNGLEAKGALKKGTDKRTKQIYGTGGKRFYCIPLDKIQ